MSTQLEIWNYSLGLLGAENVASIGENSKEAKTCATFYPIVKLNLLRSHNWNFALKRASVTGTADVPFEFKYRFQKPSDCLRIVEFFDYTGAFKEEGNYVLLN